VRAIIQERYGAPAVLELRDVDQPAIGGDDVRVRVRAAGVDQGVWHVMSGLPYPIRIAGYGLRAPRQRVPGSDLAGVVEAAGDRVTRFRPGDEVFGVGTGAYAEYARAREATLAHRPANLTLVQAAAVAVSGVTALQAVRDHAKVRPGQRVLIVGASGGVGTYAVQLAKAFGAEVSGVCSPGKADIVRSIGADHIVDYTREDFAAQRRRYHVILDVGGNSSLSRLRRALTPKGTLVIVGGETGGRWLGGTDRQVRALLLSPFVGQRLRTFVARETSDDMIVLQELIEAGRVRPVVDRTFPLSEVAAAIRYMREGRVRGKVVITV
jgi:NADPH:quinone reductase-like Zn-dependent oxidoreductase